MLAYPLSRLGIPIPPSKRPTTRCGFVRRRLAAAGAAAARFIGFYYYWCEYDELRRVDSLLQLSRCASKIHAQVLLVVFVPVRALAALVAPERTAAALLRLRERAAVQLSSIDWQALGSHLFGALFLIAAVVHTSSPLIVYTSLASVWLYGVPLDERGADTADASSTSRSSRLLEWARFVRTIFGFAFGGFARFELPSVAALLPFSFKALLHRLLVFAASLSDVRLLSTAELLEGSRILAGLAVGIGLLKLLSLALCFVYNVLTRCRLRRGIDVFSLGEFARLQLTVDSSVFSARVCDLSKRSFSRFEWEAVQNRLSGSSKVERLVLTETQLGEDGLSALATALPTMSSLRSLELSGQAALPAHAAVRLAEALTGMPGMEVVEMDGLRIRLASTELPALARSATAPAASTADGSEVKPLALTNMTRATSMQTSYGSSHRQAHPPPPPLRLSAIGLHPITSQHQQQEHPWLEPASCDAPAEAHCWACGLCRGDPFSFDDSNGNSIALDEERSFNSHDDPRAGQPFHIVLMNELSLAGRLTPLHSIRLRGSRLGDEGAQLLASGVLSQFLPELRLLDLERSSIGATGGNALGDALGNAAAPLLESINLSHNALEGEAGAALLRAIPSKCGRLRRLALRGCSLDAAAIRALPDIQLPALEQLDLSFNNLGSRGIAVVGARARGLPNLRELVLTDVGAGNAGLETLLFALPALPALVRLDVSSNPFGPKGYAALALALPSLHSLRALRAGGRTLDDVSARAFAEALRSVALHPPWCMSTPHPQPQQSEEGGPGVMAVGGLFGAQWRMPRPAARSLEEIDLSPNSAQASGARLLANALCAHPTLRRARLAAAWLDLNVLKTGSAVDLRHAPRSTPSSPAHGITCRRHIDVNSARSQSPTRLARLGDADALLVARLIKVNRLLEELAVG